MKHDFCSLYFKTFTRLFPAIADPFDQLLNTDTMTCEDSGTGGPACGSLEYFNGSNCQCLDHLINGATGCECPNAGELLTSQGTANFEQNIVENIFMMKCVKLIEICGVTQRCEKVYHFQNGKNNVSYLLFNL